uniref:Uncharacterized protein n=1 Tax=Siphoviridae sp. ctqwO1 TaxID=2826472 RepID=A0A8S5QP26_9CAUD|nr:MAG TPA: hypothetical protein [Siphoviridae sp. ctqwO1]
MDACFSFITLTSVLDYTGFAHLTLKILFQQQLY